jgi:LacI family transcriptional regulator
MEAEGIAVREEYVRNRGFQYDKGVELGSAILDLPDRPTAVFAGSDEVAAGVIEAGRERGLRVPEDLSIGGFDDAIALLHELAAPAVASARFPLPVPQRA